MVPLHPCSTSFSSQIALLIAYLLWFPFDVYFNCNFLHNCLHSAHYRVFVHQLSVLVYISSLLVSPLFFRSVQGLARLTLQSRDQDQIFNNYGLSIETEQGGIITRILASRIQRSLEDLGEVFSRNLFPCKIYK